MKNLVTTRTSIMMMLLSTLTTGHLPLMAHYNHSLGNTMDANPNVTTTEVIHNLPLDATFYNECCEEEVYMAGIATIVINPNVIHITVRDVTGIGLTTNEQYETIGAQFESNILYTSLEEGTLVFRVKMRNDNGCSFKLSGTWHITVNANGDVATAFMTTETQCLP